MEKNTVTRTISIGAICNGTKTAHLDDFSTARRHSSAGMRALLWATSSAKSFGSSLGSESLTSRENIFTNILTPGSIPQFTIPSLSVQVGLRSSENNRDGQAEEDDAETDEGLGSLGTELESSLSVSPASSTSSSVFSLSPSDRRAQRSISDPLTQRKSVLQREVSFPCRYMEAQHCLDPASRAALSLPHLTKVTTPYGFVTLSQSPQMASEEALLCQAGLRRFNREEEVAYSSSKATLTRTTDTNIKGSSSRWSAAKQRLSKDFTDSQTEGRLPKAEIQSAAASSTSASVSSSSSAPKQATNSKRKRRFYEVIRKHFTSHH